LRQGLSLCSLGRFRTSILLLPPLKYWNEPACTTIPGSGFDFSFCFDVLGK
jgi:hypothetical protein